MDGKRSKTGVSNESVSIQLSGGGYGGDVEKGRLGVKLGEKKEF